MVAFVAVEKRVRAPLLDLALLGNRFLVGSSVAIIVEAGCINALMYVCGLSFQNPDGLGMTPPLEAGGDPAGGGRNRGHRAFDHAVRRPSRRRA